MSDERARDHFDNEEELQACLDAAEEYARTDAEVKFVDEMTQKIGKYGGAAYMTEAQADWLKRIAVRAKR